MSLQQADFSNNKIGGIDVLAFYGEIKLERIDVSNNLLETIHAKKKQFM